MRVGKIGVAVIALVPFNVYGECTPTPDCASIGYTETSCEGDYLACPFDSTKLKCMPCDSSYRYNCSGDNITGGTGSACGGKYVSCECAEDTFFNNGICTCDTSCKVGAIYYSDKTCSSCLDTSKIAIGIVVKDNELIMGQTGSKQVAWGGRGTDIDSLPNITDNDVAKSDYDGKANTLLIVNSHTASGLTSSNSAAIYCNEYITEGTTAGDWYLPAVGEFYEYASNNYSKIRVTMSKLSWTVFPGYHCVATEYNYTDAWMVTFGDGTMKGNESKSTGHSVACFLAIDIY